MHQGDGGPRSEPCGMRAPAATAVARIPVRRLTGPLKSMDGHCIAGSCRTELRLLEQEIRGFVIYQQRLGEVGKTLHISTLTNFGAASRRQ